MMKLTRTPAPTFLTENAETWGLAWEARKREGKFFHWHQVDNENVREILLKLLSEMSAEHCAYCDRSDSAEEIDHFKPKRDFPRIAFEWTNLFPCCSVCNKAKGDQYDENLLRPDEKNYMFELYFNYNATTGELEPNNIDNTAQERANITIKILKLNEAKRCKQRLRAFRTRPKSIENIDDFSYRFMFE
jgi:uncharacterized protein (TIGR02646 family)